MSSLLTVLITDLTNISNNPSSVTSVTLSKDAKALTTNTSSYTGLPKAFVNELSYFNSNNDTSILSYLINFLTLTESDDPTIMEQRQGASFAILAEYNNSLSAIMNPLESSLTNYLCLNAGALDIFTPIVALSFLQGNSTFDLSSLPPAFLNDLSVFNSSPPPSNLIYQVINSPNKKNVASLLSEMLS